MVPSGSANGMINEVIINLLQASKIEDTVVLVPFWSSFFAKIRLAY